MSPVAAPASSSIPIRTSSRRASATSLGGLPDQRQRRAVAVEPAQVGDEVVASSNSSVPARCPAANAVRSRRSTTHSPASIRRRSSRGLDRLRRRQVDRGGAAAVDRAHVGVVGGVGVQPGQQAVDVVLLVQGQRRVDPGLLADRWRRRRWSGWPSRSCRSRGSGSTGGLGGQLGGQPAHRAELGVGQLHGVLRADQVGAAGGAVEHRPAGEHRRLASRLPPASLRT